MTHSVQAISISADRARAFEVAPRTQFTGAPAWIYVVQAGARGPVKIGYAAMPEVRFSDLQIGSWEELHLRACVAVMDGMHRQLEATAHSLARRHHIRGEWFKLEPLDAVACILKAADKIGAHVLSAADARAFSLAQVCIEVDESIERQRQVLRCKLGMD